MGLKLFVGSLSFNVNDQMLQDAFAQAGTVVSAKVIIDRMSGRSKGFGFVEMATSEEAQKAIDMWNGKEIDGRAVVVNEARPMEPRTGGGGSGGYRGGNGGGGRNDSSGGRNW